MGFCPYRESNPASSNSQPSHYTDYAMPASGQTRNAYRIVAAKRERTHPLSRIRIYVVEDIIKKELLNRGYEYELDLLS